LHACLSSAPLSVLDLSPIVEGSDAAQSFRNSLSLAQHAEGLGYRRFWLAEHHGMPGIASAATSVLIGHIAGGTKTIRVGAGGIMLPNHSPLVIAEQFGTLESLYPGRIDLGLGRAPGSDQATSRALRRTLQTDADEFPRDVVELMDFMSESPRQSVRAVPGTGLKVPVWILGSSLFGAQLAAMLGLPYAFASHFAPGQMMHAIELYRATFKPSAARQALRHAGLQRVRRGHRRRGGAAGHLDAAGLRAAAHRPASRLQPPVPGYLDTLMPHEGARCSTKCCPARHRFTGHRAPRHAGLHRPHRSRRADGHLPGV
jgi:alkanesulfonate monooxygenase SsuD/methylene tetrahydromethanopterin reductase-like flavin-dependent oxidoreductase (luciferase family)